MRQINSFCWILVVAICFSVIGTNTAIAGSGIYNMDRLLTEPYPLNKQTNSSSISSSKDPQYQYVREIDIKTEQETLEYSTSNISDPLEPINRITFRFNEIFQRYLLDPIVRQYRDNLPVNVRDGVNNFFVNLGSPVVLINDLLQGQFERGVVTASRFVINSTAGFAGFLDTAGTLGYPSHKEDFGQTLGYWGVGEGFYVVLPLIGPSSPRDAFGTLFVDRFFDPIGYLIDEHDLEELGYAFTAVGGMDKYSRVFGKVSHMRETSIDFYATLRNLYVQKRRSQIMNSD